MQFWVGSQVMRVPVSEFGQPTMGKFRSPQLYQFETSKPEFAVGSYFTPNWRPAMPVVSYRATVT